MGIEWFRLPKEIKHWYGNMEADYAYTLGVAGEKFFMEIKENGKLMGAKCPKCNAVYLPPRLYCENCFEALSEWVEIGDEGYVYTYTIAHLDEDGKPSEKPVIYALIKFDGVKGGLIHKLGEVKPENVKVGMRVKAVWKPKEEREGNITDILYFKPV